jgi:hypothetical protein
VQLRAADAKHRLRLHPHARRAARPQCATGQTSAIARASEALSCAEALDRPSEILLAHVVLAEARRVDG